MESVSCIICRRRKIKCDRRPVTCANCAKFGTPCSYVDTNATSASGSGVGRRAHVSSSPASSAVSATATTTQAGLQRRRILRSCTACKRAKAKCSGGASCTRCIRRSVECVYDGGRRDAGTVEAEIAATEAEYAEPVMARPTDGPAYPVRTHPGFPSYDPQPITQPGPQPVPQHGPPHAPPHAPPLATPHGSPHGAYPERFGPGPGAGPGNGSLPVSHLQPGGYTEFGAGLRTGPATAPPGRLPNNLASPISVKREQASMPAYTANTPIPSFPLHSHPSHPPTAHHTPPPQIASPPAASNSVPPSALTPVAVPAPTPVPRWLVASSLPSMDRLRSLIDSYFARIHPLRCLGFLHMPTFHERLRDQQTLYYDSYGLVHAICALAAPFVHAAETANSVIPSGTAEYHFFEAGQGWAATAMMRIFHHIGTPDVESLMTEMLLHEYYLRCGEYAKAFMLSGLVARHIQLLQLNLEYDCNPPRRSSESREDNSTPETTGGLPWAIKESRRRLVWCCYLQDAFMECGIDQLRFVNPADIQAQLPCTEELFVRGKPCITEMLQPGKLLPFVAADLQSNGGNPGNGGGGAIPAGVGAANLDLRAFYIRAMAIRAKVLKYVKHLKGDIPWSKDPLKSRFLCLDKELRALEESVPDDLRMNAENTAVFRWSGWSGTGGSGRLGLYFGVHILLAQTFNDLYRVGVANLVFPHHATQWIRTNAPLDFLVECHRMCSTKAATIASLLEEVWQTDRLSLVDTPYAMHAQVCSSVMVMTMISWQSLCQRQKEQLKQRRDGGEKAKAADQSNANLIGPLVNPQMVPVLPIHRRLLESNLTILDFLRCYIKADLYYESAKQALKRFEQLEEAARNSAAAAAAAAAGEPAPAPSDAPQFSLEYILNPLGVYPMARQQARNRHEPQTNPPPPSEPSAANPGITLQQAAPPSEQSSAPASRPASPLTSAPSVSTAAPATVPVPMLSVQSVNMQGVQSAQSITSTPVQSMPAVDSTQSRNGEHGTHNMAGTPASIGMQPGMVPPPYYQQRTVPMYDTNMSGITDTAPGADVTAPSMPVSNMGDMNNLTAIGDMGGMDSNMGSNMGSNMASNMNESMAGMNNMAGVGNMDNMNSMNSMGNMGNMSNMGNMNAGLNMGIDTTDGGEQAMFSMWNWESEVPSMDNMGYPTFLEAFQVT
ncbi:fungal transcriptional regulatory protein [Ophiostoma piceae UAMH 11346]|uniref:Fungal transcriptional regulatory protein n=1 Tax=Ophiostoma piceae (strain UAMH 11346) TaxID=1262450 RepID=S3C355_OPHP1|nr:fungal transcriptional regulatory protein [Ophiostoma piceae UAMH 11346]